MNKFIYVMAITALVIGVWISKEVTQPKLSEYALYFQPERALKPFKLTDHHGKPFSNQQLIGKWSLLFLGYTSCPDICPTTLQNLNFIYDDLKKIAPNTQILLLSADPKRDTQKKLSQYIAYFNPEFIALRADHDVLFPFTRNLGLMYSITTGEGAEYLVDHSASMVLINPNGNISAMFKPEETVGQIVSIDTNKLVSDYQRIVNLYSAQ